MMRTRLTKVLFGKIFLNGTFLNFYVHLNLLDMAIDAINSVKRNIWLPKIVLGSLLLTSSTNMCTISNILYQKDEDQETMTCLTFAI